MIKEEDRLASVITEIDEDVRIVPRGAFVKKPTGQVVPNRSFEGTQCSLISKVKFWTVLFLIFIFYVSEARSDYISTIFSLYL